MTVPGQPHSGQACPFDECDGVLEVYSSKIKGTSRVRFFRCNKCGKMPDNNKQSIPLGHAPPRRTSFI